MGNLCKKEVALQAGRGAEVQFGGGLSIIPSRDRAGHPERVRFRKPAARGTLCRVSALRTLISDESCVSLRQCEFGVGDARPVCDQRARPLLPGRGPRLLPCPGGTVAHAVATYLRSCVPVQRESGGSHRHTLAGGRWSVWGWCSSAN